jgi:hypothetical protein
MIELTLVTNDSIPVGALPSGYGCSVAHLIDAPCRKGFEGAHDFRKAVA